MIQLESLQTKILKMTLFDLKTGSIPSLTRELPVRSKGRVFTHRQQLKLEQHQGQVERTRNNLDHYSYGKAQLCTAASKQKSGCLLT